MPLFGRAKPAQLSTAPGSPPASPGAAPKSARTLGFGARSGAFYGMAGDGGSQRKRGREPAQAGEGASATVRCSST